MSLTIWWRAVVDTVPETLAWRRRMLGLSQAEVAGQAGSTQATLSSLENGARDARLSP